MGITLDHNFKVNHKGSKGTSHDVNAYWQKGKGKVDIFGGKGTKGKGETNLAARGPRGRGNTPLGLGLSRELGQGTMARASDQPTPITPTLSSPLWASQRNPL